MSCLGIISVFTRGTYLSRSHCSANAEILSLPISLAEIAATSEAFLISVGTIRSRAVGAVVVSFPVALVQAWSRPCCPCQSSC